MRRVNKAVLIWMATGVVAGSLLTTPAALAQRYLVNGHLATSVEAQVLESNGFDAGAWRMDGWGISLDVAHADFVPERRLSRCHYVLDVPLDCDVLLASR